MTQESTDYFEAGKWDEHSWKIGQWSHLEDHSDIYIFINILSSTGILACIMMTGPDTEITISWELLSCTKKKKQKKKQNINFFQAQS
jgi:hypothetical protein